MSRHEEKPILREGSTCWRKARAERFALIVDAADYFAAAKDAMLRARHSILLIGWDFDLRIKLTPGDESSDTSDELGPFLKEILRRRPHLHINILKWDMAVLFTLSRQLLPLLSLDLFAPRRLDMRFDSAHPWMSAHHQKIAVIDDALAFCGGIDMTSDRWDTRSHMPGDERRVRPSGEPHGPWHDATAAVDGEAARALGELARRRWHLATGETLEPPEPGRKIWPARLAPQLRDVEVAIARTMPSYEGRGAIREIEGLYLAAIGAARRSIYLESQYFASARICEAIAERLGEREGPEVVVVNPETAEGWLEEKTMGAARAMCVRNLREADRHGRFGIFYPVNEAGEPIYVHAKILIVDDRLLRVGSSNINNRSLGFDSECDLAIEALPRDPDTTRDVIRAMRTDLLAEHLAAPAEQVAEAVEAHGLLGAIEKLSRGDGRGLRRLEPEQPNAAEEAVVRSRLADPERPKRIDTRLAHLAKRLTLTVPLGAVTAIAGLVAGTALGLGYRARSRRRRPLARR